MILTKTVQSPSTSESSDLDDALLLMDGSAYEMDKEDENDRGNEERNAAPFLIDTGATSTGARIARQLSHVQVLQRGLNPSPSPFSCPPFQSERTTNVPRTDARSSDVTTTARRRQETLL